MAARVILQIHLQNLFDPPDMLFRLNGEEQFHPVVQVAGHPVGRTEEVFWISAVGEYQYARVFEICVDDTHRRDILADAWQPWHKRAIAADEQTYLHSRFDLYVETTEEKWFVEVKGVTLNVDGTAMFPDAPTERGKKHVEELIQCLEDGYRGAILFVIQMKGVTRFMPFEERQPEFAEALRKAKEAGVEIYAVDCLVDGESIQADQLIPVQLGHNY